ncbi:cbb3-type cytochrome c oxidase subunit III [Modicisalibacter xianhensis]|uniref:Cbb3-type cytochrome c oxidase subunit III n=1 Tax=Modicisalibacter xianhensis TaxID=442341 RepID=A0A4R8FYC2_9GAMM|nr:cytochrome c [Halomonas xianhensis]TDX31650.1 cbb3-type cytochrome c oxidase subunit III [Halomonas xianhensis]
MRSVQRFMAVLIVSSVTGPALAGGELTNHEAEPLEAGEGIYRQYCASCHGIEGEGQPNWERQNALGELPAPPHNPEGHTWKHSDAMLYRIIAEGWRDPWNKTERLTMPAFEEVLTPQQIRLVINYLKTLWTPEQRQHQQRESQDKPFP